MKRESPDGGQRLRLPRALPALLLSVLAGACSVPADDMSCPIGSGLAARVMAAPFCVQLEVVQDDDCSCDGEVVVTNDCRVDIIASGFVFDDFYDTIAPGETRTISVVEGETTVTAEQAFTLEADGEEFAVLTHCTW